MCNVPENWLFDVHFISYRSHYARVILTHVSISHEDIITVWVIHQQQSGHLSSSHHHIANIISSSCSATNNTSGWMCLNCYNLIILLDSFCFCSTLLILTDDGCLHLPTQIWTPVMIIKQSGPSDTTSCSPQVGQRSVPANQRSGTGELTNERPGTERRLEWRM